MRNLVNLTALMLTIRVAKTGELLAEQGIPERVIKLWAEGKGDMHTDLGRIMDTLQNETPEELEGIVRGYTSTLDSEGNVTEEKELAEVGKYVRRQSGWKYETLTSERLTEGERIKVDSSDLPEYKVEIKRVTRAASGLTIKRTPDSTQMYDGSVSTEKVLEFVNDYISKKMTSDKKNSRLIDMEYTLIYSDVRVGTGSWLNGYTPAEHDAEAAELLAEQFNDITTGRHREDVIKFMSGMAVRDFIQNEATGKNIDPQLMKGFAQDGIYVRTQVPVYTEVNVYGKMGKFEGTKRKIIMRDQYEPAHGLADYVEDFISVFISKDIMKSMGDKPELYAETRREIINIMKGHKTHKFFIIGRKGRLIFSNKPFGDTKITRDFMTVNINRGEHLGQLVTARGIRGTGSTPQVEVITSIVADGVTWALTVKQGLRLGFTEGIWQIRSVNPYSKGILIVSDIIKLPFLNEDAIKVKPRGTNGQVEWPLTIEGKDIIAISKNSTYPMKFPHQLGYVFVENFLKSKGKMKPWGMWPEAIAKNVNSETVRKSLPAQYARLESIGLPHDYFRQPEGLIESLVSAARPELCNLSMFACLPIERLDPARFPVVGYYCPISPDAAKGRYILRIPALAVGGAVQDLYAKDAKGKKVLATDKNGDELSSPIPFTLIAAIHEAKEVGKDNDGNTLLQFPDDVELGGDGRSRIIWEQLAAMGADSDGDRVGRTFRKHQGNLVDQMLEEAGLKCDRNVPLLKTKNPYDGITDWMTKVEDGQERDVYDEGHRGILWDESTPNLGLVGKGDVMTQGTMSLVFGGIIKLDEWKSQAIAGANIVQRGVSAPKYSMNINYYPMYEGFQINAMLEEHGIGNGYEEKGLLFDPARAKVQEELGIFFPPAGQHNKVAATHPIRKWEGGMSGFFDKIALFDESMGDMWVPYVEEQFKRELLRMHLLSLGELDAKERQVAATNYAREFRKGNMRKRVRQYVSAFINKYPEKDNIWAWMLSAEFIRPEFTQDRRPDGLALTTPELEDGIGRTLEIMGMPFDLERLEAKEAKRQAAIQKRKDNKR